jgi:hypothetical protein
MFGSGADLLMVVLMAVMAGFSLLVWVFRKTHREH